jgi:RHS repeat-associated protein
MPVKRHVCATRPQIVIAGTMNFNMQYVYSTSQNNGQITQAIDAVSGETIDYAYDSLNRLITAATTGPQWGLSFSYDGFGNRLTQTVTKGTAPASSVSVNASTNRINSSGYVYDSNGNLTTMPYGAGSMTLTYDVDNRLIQAVNSNGTEQYGYSPDNRRVYQKTPSGAQLIHFYGANGDRLRTYTYYGNGQFQVSNTNLYFAGRLIHRGNTVAFIDRLGSDRNGTQYYPYGEEYTATTQDRDKFATYFRDSSTGLDYAMNRYYGSNLGRFTTPDPSRRFNPADPRSLNQYSYTGGDPINATDRSGLYWELLGCEDAGYLDAESEMSGRQWRNCYYTSVEDEYATGPIQRPRIRRGGGGEATPNKYIVAAVDNAKSILEEDNPCSRFFGAYALEALSALSKVLRPGRIENEQVGIRMSVPQTSTAPYRVPTVATVNSNGPFLTPRGPDFGGYNPGTGQSQTLQVLHELAHLLSNPSGAGWLIPDDGGNAKQSEENTETIMKNCKDQIDKIK